MSKAAPDDQLVMLTGASSGAITSRDELERQGRKRRSAGGQASVRLPRIKIPLASETASGLVTVAAESMDLEDAERLLREALRAVRPPEIKTSIAGRRWPSGATSQAPGCKPGG